jgi:hypothetical protein
MAVSSTSVYGFKYRKSLSGMVKPVSHNFLLNDSAEFTIGDAVRLDSDGLLVVASAGGPIVGILDGIVDRFGVNAFSPRAQGTLGSTLTPDDTITVSSTNSSDATRKLKGQVLLDVGGDILWYNDSDDTLAQTNVGQLFDTTAMADRISVTTASDTSGGFQLLEIDPDGDSDASKGLFRIVENQLIGHLGNATTVIS